MCLTALTLALRRGQWARRADILAVFEEVRIWQRSKRWQAGCRSWPSCPRLRGCSSYSTPFPCRPLTRCAGCLDKCVAHFATFLLAWMLRAVSRPMLLQSSLLLSVCSSFVAFPVLAATRLSAIGSGYSNGRARRRSVFLRLQPSCAQQVRARLARSLMHAPADQSSSVRQAPAECFDPDP